MKKFTKIIALTLVLIMSLAILTSCAVPNKAPEKAMKALEKNGYDATLIDGVIAANQFKGCEYYIIAGDENDNTLLVYYFRDKNFANEAWDSLDEDAAKAKLEVSEDIDIVMKKSGKMIYFGTKDAVKAAK